MSCRLRVPGLVLLLGMVLTGWGFGFASEARGQGAQDKAEEPPSRVGQFFSVVEPITDDVIEEIRIASGRFLDQAAEKGIEPVLVFEFRAGDARPGSTSAGNAADLADYLLGNEVRAARSTVAYVPESLSGYALLPVLACGDIVLGEEATLGPITPEGEPLSDTARGELEKIARRQGRDLGLLLGMLEPDADLREVKTADGQTRFVRASDLEELRQEQQVLSEAPAWEGGSRGQLRAERARALGLAKLLAADRKKIAETYGMESAADDPTLSGPLRPVLIKIDGAIDRLKEEYLKRRISTAVNKERVNLIVFVVNSEGGEIDPTREVVSLIARQSANGVKTVAFVDDRAYGLSALLLLACDEIIVRTGSKIGDGVRVVDREGDVGEVNGAVEKALAETAVDLAHQKFHPEAVAQALFDLRMELVQATDNQTGAGVFLSRQAAEAEPARYNVVRTIKPAGESLALDADQAQALGLSRRSTTSLKQWLRSQGLEKIRVDGPTWVDSLVTTLNEPWMSWLLLFVGAFMLIVEAKLPGVGLPAICSALAFLLYFWGHYLGGTANQLEILLFLVGVVCLAMELFVFPGFGVFGLSGILLVLSSVVMASHTFVWPTRDYEYQQMGRTLTSVLVMIVGVVAAVIALGRYFPSMPLFRRMILAPEPAGSPEAVSDKPAEPYDPESSLFFLIGETGRTTTVCKPSGKARFGERLVDVYADGFYIEANAPVEVTEVRGSRVWVKKI